MSTVSELKSQGEQLFTKRGSLLSLWQTIADNFYPERADFTTVRNLGEDFAANLTTSYPVLARRDLGNAIGSMLRPTSKSWMHLRTEGWDRLDRDGKAWLEWAEGRMRKAMYHKKSQFSRATKEADHDFASFGQCVIQTSLNRDGDGLLYRCWHLRDVAWVENTDGQADTVYRKWKPTAIELSRIFKNIHANVRSALDKEPYKEFNVWHVILPTDVYPKAGGAFKTKYVSVYIDVDNDHIMEEIGVPSQEYTVPRWQTVSGSQYAYSPATVAALPDARLIQSMTLTLLEAGEKAVTPPMIAVAEAIRSDVSLYAGGITWVDEAYDERLGEVLRPVTQQSAGITYGMEMARDTRAMIAEAFFLNKLTLPQPGNEMTAYEVGQRVQEYIRQALPLFEPMEFEYNSPVCEKTFELGFRSGLFGSPFDIPKSLQGQEVQFLFESPLHDATEREKGQRFLEAKSMLADAVALDPSTRFIVDAKIALREVLTGIGVPAMWTRSEDEVGRMEQAAVQQQQTAQLLQNMQAGADVAKTVGEIGGIPPSAQGE